MSYYFAEFSGSAPDKRALKKTEYQSILNSEVIKQYHSKQIINWFPDTVFLSLRLLLFFTLSADL